jgi:hypothetical protein
MMLVRLFLTRSRTGVWPSLMRSLTTRCKVMLVLVFPHVTVTFNLARITTPYQT